MGKKMVNIINDDPLQFCLDYLFFDWMQKNRVKYKYTSWTIWIVSHIFGVICGAYVINEKGWRNCLSYLLMLPGLEAGGGMMLICNAFYDPFDVFRNIITNECFKLSTACPKLRKEILKQIKLLKLYVAVLSIFGIIVTVAFSWILGDEENIFLHYALLKRIFGEFYKIPYIITNGVLCFVVMYEIILLVVMGGYIIYHMVIQLMLMEDYVKQNIKKLPQNKSYTRRVKKNLTRCVDVFNSLNNAKNIITNTIGVTFIIETSFCYMVIVFQIVFIYLQISPTSNIRMGMILIFAISIILPVALLGQRLYDQLDKYFSAVYDCPWYNWSKSNQKMLLIILPQQTRSLGITFFGLVTLNHEFILTVLEKSYKFAAVAIQVKEAYN